MTRAEKDEIAALKAEVARMRPVFKATMARFLEKLSEFGGIDSYVNRVRKGVVSQFDL